MAKHIARQFSDKATPAGPVSSGAACSSKLKDDAPSTCTCGGKSSNWTMLLAVLCLILLALCIYFYRKSS